MAITKDKIAGKTASMKDVAKWISDGWKDRKMLCFIDGDICIMIKI